MFNSFYLYIYIYIVYYVWHKSQLYASCSRCPGLVRPRWIPQLGTAEVWNNKDFETFFEGHYEEWDFDAKNLS